MDNPEADRAPDQFRYAVRQPPSKATGNNQPLAHRPPCSHFRRFITQGTAVNSVGNVGKHTGLSLSVIVKSRSNR
jgi:hypothetical protein